MWDVASIAALLSVLALVLVRFGGGFISLFFGRRLTWLWVALAVYNIVSRGLAVALYRETDVNRLAPALVVGIVAAVAAALLARRFPKAVLAIGGFLAGGLIAVQALGPLLNPFPEWLVISLLIGAGFLSGAWAMRNPESAGIVLSALVGAGIMTTVLMNRLQLEESVRLQVYAVLALAGIGFQFWRERRTTASAAIQIPGA
jgi:MFS family permease